MLQNDTANVTKHAISEAVSSIHHQAFNVQYRSFTTETRFDESGTFLGLVFKIRMSLCARSDDLDVLTSMVDVSGDQIGERISDQWSKQNGLMDDSVDAQIYLLSEFRLCSDLCFP